MRFSRLAALVYFLFALAVGMFDISLILHDFVRLPSGDHWIWLAKLDVRGTWAAFSAQYNEHRVVFPGLFYLIDHRYFGTSNRFIITAIITLNTGSIALVWLALWKQTELPQAIRLVFGGFVIILMFWFIQGPNFFYAYQICIALCDFCIIAALYLFARDAERLEGGIRPSMRVWIVIVLSGTVATFSFGYGILIWPILIILTLVLRLQRRILWIAAAALVCNAGIYLFHYLPPAHPDGPFGFLRSPVHFAQYVVLLIGLPWFGNDRPDVDLLHHLASYVITIGGIALAILLWLRFLFIKPVRKNLHEIFFPGLILLALSSALITAAGRSGFPVNQALSGRYAALPVLFWISLAALVTTYVCRLEIHAGALRVLWCGLLVVASVATLPTQFTASSYMASRARSQQAAVGSMALGVPDHSRIFQELYPAMNLLEFVDNYTVHSLNRPSLFSAPETQLVGTPLKQKFEIAPPATCIGAVDSVEHLPPAAHEGASLVGWAFAPGPQKQTNRVWVIDSQGVIQGFGISDVPRAEVAAALNNPRMNRAGWLAYARLPQDGPLTVFGELDGGKVCQIGQPRIAAVPSK